MFVFNYSVRTGIRSLRDMPKENVVSFRLDEKKFKALQDVRKKDMPVNVNSENQLCRKIVTDFLAGRLEYKNPAHRSKDYDTLGD
jgi:hypothetical protein